jgi:hypothetical protein
VLDDKGDNLIKIDPATEKKGETVPVEASATFASRQMLNNAGSSLRGAYLG